MKKAHTLRLFGRWTDAAVQGTERTYRVYACHPLDRILTVGLFLTVWVMIFLFAFCRSGKPGEIGIYFRGLGVFFPPDRNLFLFWMAIALPCVVLQVLEHGRQRRILRGELIARQGILRQIGYFRYRGRGGIKHDYRIALEVSAGGKTSREVYDLSEALFEEFYHEAAPRACRTELFLLPSPKPKKRYFSLDIPRNCVDMLHMRVEAIVCLETLPGRCRITEGSLFDADQYGRKKTKK